MNVFQQSKRRRLFVRDPCSAMITLALAVTTTSLVRANTPLQIKLVPVPPPADSKWAATSTYTIEAKGDKADTAVLSKGGEPVWFEIKLTDFDPKQEGAVLTACRARIDGSGYTSGKQGTVTPYVVPCANDADCQNQVASWSKCGGLGFPAGVCWYATVRLSRPDSIGNNIKAWDVSGPDIGYINSSVDDQTKFLGSCVNDPSVACDTRDGQDDCINAGVGGDCVLDKNRQYYIGDVVFFVSANAKGQFTLPLLGAPNSECLDFDANPLPLEIVPGHVTVQVGQCCFDLESGSPGCVDELRLDECEAQPGVTVFTPDATCSDPCPACGDNLINTPLEECDGSDDSACPGGCLADCTCGPFCGDDLVNGSAEECDGSDDAACPGACLADCTCGPFCGDDVVNSSAEACDGTDDSACPCRCLSDCTCEPLPGAVPTVSAWGVAILTLLLLSGARIYFGRRRRNETI